MTTHAVFEKIPRLHRQNRRDGVIIRGRELHLGRTALDLFLERRWNNVLLCKGKRGFGLCDDSTGYKVGDRNAIRVSVPRRFRAALTEGEYSLHPDAKAPVIWINLKGENE